uniref:Uncharacterized protein n=1 Tax=Rhodnius prolixus TaxID=13249 RepID=T1IAY5_RHOPR
MPSSLFICACIFVRLFTLQKYSETKKLYTPHSTDNHHCNYLRRKFVYDDPVL